MGQDDERFRARVRQLRALGLPLQDAVRRAREERDATTRRRDSGRRRTGAPRRRARS